MSEGRDHPARPPELTFDEITRLFFFFIVLQACKQGLCPMHCNNGAGQGERLRAHSAGVFKGKTPNGELHALVLLDWAGG